MNCRQIMNLAFKNEDGKDIIFTLPSNLTFYEYIQDDSIKKVTIEFNKLAQMGINESGEDKDSDALNMQNDEACFEGWAAAIYTYHLNKEGKIYLKVSKSIDTLKYAFDKISTNPHFARFLYRILRFTQLYDWFELEGKLIDLKDKFKSYLSDYTFINNYPDKDGTSIKNLTNYSLKSEKDYERFFSGDIEKGFDNLASKAIETLEPLKIKELKEPRKEVYRQLPICLFKDNVDTKNRVFPGRASAIDLWTIKGDTFCPIELKTQNPMVGMITEIFFYSNFAYDFFIEGHDENSNLKLNMPKKIRGGYKKMTRGYGKIINPENKLRKVKGYLLLDKDSRHPLVGNELISVLSKSTNPNITYGGIIEYELF